MSEPVSPFFLEAFRLAAGGEKCLRFDRFMELALYDPALGYYRSRKQRVGFGQETDFYTSTSTGPLFGELLCAGVGTLLSARGLSPADFQFIELGAEPGGGVLSGVRHPFAAYRTVGIADSWSFSGDCIVFSNELFDAQPCRRFIRKSGLWFETGVGERDGALAEVELAPVSEEWLPEEAPDGYRFDAPRASVSLIASLWALPWKGLFLAFDYGKRFAELAESQPSGTLRAYSRHTQSAELLARPGEQDLTCHVCWDWLEQALAARGAAALRLESQESFFVKNSGEFIAATIAQEALRASPRKQALLQLLHPTHLGQKFQALHAWRAA